MKYFMLDIETMGTDFETDDIIQIAFLELNQQADGTYSPEREYSRTLHTSQKPKNEWIRVNHAALLEVCRRTPMSCIPQVRLEILDFFKQCGVTGPTMLMGLNATTFDVPYMVHKGYFNKPDYHYRIYELKGAYNLARDILGLDDKQLWAKVEGECPEVQLPAGKKHEALYDCYKQTKLLNGIIRLLRRSKGGLICQF